MRTQLLGVTAVLLAVLSTGALQETEGPRWNFLQSVMALFSAGSSQSSSTPPDKTLLPEYDFIVVGAGTAGCVLANRLTENPNWKVLLIEAGRDENFVMDVPLLANYFQFTDSNWKYRTEPQEGACLGLNNGRCNWPRGKVMGGSSVLNYMMYTRGNRMDYDRWAAKGNEGWSYNDVLPYFLKLEDIAVPNLDKSPYHHKGGPVTISYPPYHTPLATAFLRAGKEIGYNVTDYNGATQTGFSYIQTSTRNGERWSSSRAYIQPIRTRKNLSVKREAMVTKVLIDPRTMKAYGIQMRIGGRNYLVRSRMEVIISAGTINTPQLLMLSGVGPKEHLSQLGIPVIADLRVGENLQDHIASGALNFIVNESVSLGTNKVINDPNTIVDYAQERKGPLTVPGGVEAIAFVNTRLPRKPEDRVNDFPDVELFFIGGLLANQPIVRRAFGIREDIYKAAYAPTEGMDGWTVFPMLLRPKSRGKILLRSRDPSEKPIIMPNYFQDPEDLEVIVEGILTTIALSKTKPFQEFGSRLNTLPIPPCAKFPVSSRDYWRCATRHITLTIYHHVGTAKMGPQSDPTAVVDPRLRVYGIKGLRVIDASIMPQVPTAHTNAPTFMIAEKGSDMIKEDWAKYRS
ncbi:glucose dehydrogenase [FAD, quinone]-like [Hetaerina americana]|uniref:glucose dehydrogenase [FAD, quinone]-like n=1 Tax=Hetaerina americana TaxID=62018 RepID=UPI003A7F13BC